jgi:hypothetical protein
LGRQGLAGYETTPFNLLLPVANDRFVAGAKANRKEVLLSAAALRARYRLRTSDSILLATGIRSAATAAITNDNGWKAAQRLEIEMILLSQLVLNLQALCLSDSIAVNLPYCNSYSVGCAPLFSFSDILLRRD